MEDFFRKPPSGLNKIKMKEYLLVAVCMILGFSKCRAQDTIVDDFIPKDYVIVETTYGDLNKDGQEDCILIIKGTDKNNIVVNEYDETVDRNRRGIIILFKNQDSYQLAAKNQDCFSSENEDGGVYFPPELWVGVERGNLVAHYGHGRYGFWRYIFRYQETNFKLIGYDASNNYGPVINKEISINFLTKKKLIRENINHDAESGDEVFKETWSKYKSDKLLNLSEIESFEGLDMSEY